MSSNVYLKFEAPVQISAWQDFCKANDIAFAPNVIGQNTFYSGEIEISLGGHGDVSTEDRPARPPAVFGKLTIGSFFGRNLGRIGEVAVAVHRTFGGTADASPELDHTIVEIPREYVPDRYSDWLPTDGPEAWLIDGDGLTAAVQAGIARIETGDGRHKLTIDGVHRSTFSNRDSALAYAGRCDWEWWGGEFPVEQAAAQPLLRP